MASPASHFKLGLLALAAILSVLAIAFALGAGRLRLESVPYVTYFDESVQGLEIGAPVKFRGVQIGSVRKIEVAEDRRMIAVHLAIEKRAADQLQLAQLSDELRAQLVIQGITGVKLVELDLVDPERSPAPVLSFTPPERYIPSRPSLVGRVGNTAEAFAEQLPALAVQLTATLAQMTSTLANFDTLVDEFRGEKLPKRTAHTIEGLDRAVTKLNGVLDELRGDRGLLVSVRRASDALGDVGRGASRTTEDLQRTLDAIGDAARSFRAFMDALEREPDMLVKGRARRERR